jgi:hypothetical protein
MKRALDLLCRNLVGFELRFPDKTPKPASRS